MSTLEVNKLAPLVDNGTITLGDSGDTFTIPSGVTLTNNGTANGFDGLGKVGQVVYKSSQNNLNTNSTSYTSIFSESITPSSTSSKVLVIHTPPSYVDLSNSSNMAHIALFRDSTNITTSGHNSSWTSLQYVSGSSFGAPAIIKLDSPSTTSAVSYSVRGKVDNTGLTFEYNPGSQQRSMSLTLIEILA